jgi:hypothetical protein
MYLKESTSVLLFYRPTVDLIEKVLGLVKGNATQATRHSLDRNANMAHLLRRTAVGGLALQTTPVFQFRAFSHALPRGAFNRDQAQLPRAPSERSVRIAAKEMSQLGSDFGLLPGRLQILRMSRQNETSC